MVMEAVGGGWGKEARSELAKKSALATGEFASDHDCAIMLRQQLSMILHRENARASLSSVASLATSLASALAEGPFVPLGISSRS